MAWEDNKVNDIYKEVRCTHYCDIEHYWCVDAWKTSNDNEAGRVVAIINDFGGVFYRDPEAQQSTMVVECIKDKLREMKENAVKISGTPETIIITLDETRHPAAYSAKLKDLMSTGLTEADARKAIADGLEMEVVFSEQGVFLIESEALESVDCVNPYDGTKLIVP